MQLSFGERTEEMTLFGPGDTGTNVNDIAICFKYKSTLDIGYGAAQPQYYSPYVYLTDVGIDKISPGMMAEIPFDIPYVSEITGYRIVCFGNITADVKGAVISNYSYRKPENADAATSGDVLENTYSMSDAYMLGNIIVDQVQKTRNWPLAAAFSMVITLISVIGIMMITRTNSKDAQLKKKNTKEDNYVGGVQ